MTKPTPTPPTPETTTTAAAAAAFTGSYPEPFTRDYARIGDKLTRAVCEDLDERGYVVIDDCFGHGWASALLSEMKWLHTQGHFKPNKTQFALTQRTTAAPATATTASPPQMFQFVKPNIFEVDLHDASIRERVPELDALFHSKGLMEILSSHLPHYDLKMTTRGRTLKLQRNAGHGGCFPCHYDNPGRPNSRKLTCLLYLNDAWQPGDGGEVQLLPFLQPPVTVAPRMDRLVIFQSDWMLHRVLPSHVERYCLTVWIDGGLVNQPADTQLRITPDDLADWLGFLDRLRRSPVQRLLSRGVYEEEYLESLTQCMQDAPEGFVELLKSHETHLENLRRNGPLFNFIRRLRMTRELGTESPIIIN